MSLLITEIQKSKSQRMKKAIISLKINVCILIIYAFQDKNV